MTKGLPVIIVTISALLVVVALIGWLVWKKQKTGKSQQPVIRNKKAFLALFLTGLVLALTGGFFMFDGDIVGENTTSIARVLGILGIGLIAASNVTIFNFKHRD